MAIEIGTETVTVKTQRRTAQLHIHAPLGGVAYSQVFRETVKVVGEESETKLDPEPIVVLSSEMLALVEYADIPDKYKALIPDKAALAKLFQLFPLIVSIAGDAAEVRQGALLEQARLEREQSQKELEAQSDGA